MNLLTLTAMVKATMQIKTMTATAPTMRLTVAHLMRPSPRLANAVAACLTLTPTATALRIALTIAQRLRIRLKLIATAMESAKRAKRSPTAMQTAFLIHAILPADLRKIAMATVFQIRVMLRA
jgi:hypothetical protein